MNHFLESNAFEALSSILDGPVAGPEEPEPESERDSVYYFDIIVFKVCNYLLSCLHRFHLSYRSKGWKYALSHS